jgi:hypothetical protein
VPRQQLSKACMFLFISFCPQENVYQVWELNKKNPVNKNIARARIAK